MTEPRNAPDHNRRYLVLIPLALAAVLTVMIVYYIVKPVEPPVNAVPGNGGPSLADRVRKSAANLIRIRQYNEAFDLMNSYIAKFPDDVEVRPLLAKTLMEKGENLKAEIVVDQAIRISPRMSEVLWLKGELVRRRAQGNHMYFFRKSVEESSDATPELLSRFGRELLAQNQPDEGAVWLRQALDHGCKDVRTVGALGEAEFLCKNYAKARELLEKAAEKSPNDPHLALLLAGTYRRLGQLDTAGNVAGAMLADHPDAELYMELGEIRLAQKRPLEAGNAFVEASDFTQYRAEAAARAAEIFYEQRLYARAAEQIGHAFECRPLDLKIKRLRSKILKATSQPATGKTSAKP